MIIVKEVKKEDIKDFAKREWKRFNKGKGYEYNKKKYFLAAYENKELIGYTKFDIIGGIGKLSILMILKEKRKMGIGNVLLKKFEEFCRNKNCHKLFLLTCPDIHNAVEFYQKNEYEIESELNNERFNKKWLIMSKVIK